MNAYQSGQTISIGIADDHKVLRQTLRRALSTDFSVILEAEDGLELLMKLNSALPDVLLLDLKMSNVGGIQALRVINEKFPLVRVLIFTAYYDQTFVAQCLDLGVNGFLTKNMDLEEIIQAIRMAANNEVYTTNLIQHQLMRKYITIYKKRDEDLLPNFSAEEIKIMELLKQEKTTKEISSIMNFSLRSIEMKRDKMREKAHVKTVAGLLLHAIKRGLIDE